MTTSIGDEEGDDSQQSGIDDESRVRKDDPDGEGAIHTDRDTTAEEIEEGNDRNVSSDQGNRSGATNRIRDDGVIERVLAKRKGRASGPGRPCPTVRAAGPSTAPRCS